MPPAHAYLSEDHIVDVARSLVEESDGRNWTVRSLCQRLDIAQSTLLEHFPGGAAAVAARLRTRYLQDLNDAVDNAEGNETAPGLCGLNAGSHAARFTRGVIAYLDFAAARPHAYRMLFDPIEGENAELAEEVTAALRGRFAERLQTAARARELNRPVLSRDEAERLANIFRVQLHGFAALRQSGMLGAAPDTLAEGLLVSMLHQSGFAVAANPIGLEAVVSLAKRETERIRQRRARG